MAPFLKKISILLITGVPLSFNIENMQAYAAKENAEAVIYSAPFNASEEYYTDISPFYRWTSVLKRMAANPKTPKPWADNKIYLQSLSAIAMAEKVNNLVNKYQYTADQVNWGKSDYWATPAEFFSHGGDCEDFAIAKYAWLSALGVSEEKLRIAVVYDRIKNIPHAVLIVYINNKAMILDSQVRDIRDSNTTNRYRPIYSINRSGWWYPTGSGRIKLSMTEDITNLEPAGGSEAIQFPEECLAGMPLQRCLNAIEPSAR